MKTKRDDGVFQTVESKKALFPCFLVSSEDLLLEGILLPTGTTAKEVMTKTRKPVGRDTA